MHISQYLTDSAVWAMLGFVVGALARPWLDGRVATADRMIAGRR